ncbi:MAG: hypothetical protein ABIF12_00680 [bacterium]
MKNTIILFLTISIFISQNIKTQTLQELLQEKYTDVLFDELLGKGGTGEIWGSSNSDLTIKGGSSLTQCEKIKKEFEIQNNFYETVKNYNGNFLKRVYILKPEKIIQNSDENICAMEIPRLYPIKEELNKNLITQLHLGVKNKDLIEKADEDLIKGHSIGLEEFKKIINSYPQISPEKTNLEQAFADIGTLLGILHFKAKLDGLDTELCIVRKSPDANEYQLTLLDFGMCKDLKKDFVNKKTNKIAKKIVRALTIEPIFPNPITPEFNIFMQEYINIAKMENLENLAKTIILNFVGQQFLKNNIIKKYLMKKLNTRQSQSIQIKRLLPILYKWTKQTLISKIEPNYNISEDEITNTLEKLIPKIIEEKEKQNLDTMEKILIKKLK